MKAKKTRSSKLKMGKSVNGEEEVQAVDGPQLGFNSQEEENEPKEVELGDISDSDSDPDSDSDSDHASCYDLILKLESPGHKTKDCVQVQEMGHSFVKMDTESNEGMDLDYSKDTDMAIYRYAIEKSIREAENHAMETQWGVPLEELQSEEEGKIMFT